MPQQMATDPVFSLPMVTLCRTHGDNICEYIDEFDMVSLVQRAQPLYQRAMVRVSVEAFFHPPVVERWLVHEAVDAVTS